MGGDGFQEGQLVRVNYDGVNYDCVVRYAHFNWWIGNPTLTKDSSENGNMDDGIDYIEKSEHYVDSGEPFCYIVHNYYNTRYALFTLDTKPRTVTFTPMEKEIIPMAEKFLPPGIGGLETVWIGLDGKKKESVAGGEIGSFTYAEANELFDKWANGKVRVIIQTGGGLGMGSGSSWCEADGFSKDAEDSSGTTYTISVTYTTPDEVKSIRLAGPND